MAEYKTKFDIQTAEKRKNTYEYQRIVSKTYKRGRKAKKLQFGNENKTKRKAVIREIKDLQNSRLNIPAYPVFDQDYRKIQYNRYADDFVIGV